MEKVIIEIPMRTGISRINLRPIYRVITISFKKNLQCRG